MLDDSDQSPGWKFAEYEMKGVPLRIEIGPRDMEAGNFVAARRDNGEKTVCPIDELESKTRELLDAVQAGLYESAKKNLTENTFPVTTLDEARAVIEKGGFIKMMWCGGLDCELKVKDELGISSRCIPFEQEQIGDICPICGKPAKHMVVWGVAY